MNFAISKQLQATISYILQMPQEARSDEQIQIISNYLRQGKYFSNIQDEEILFEISKHLKIESYASNQLIFKENTPGDSYYIILSGKVVGYKTQNNKNEQLFTLETGQSFGEMALLSDSVRMCSIKAVENTDLIIITKDIYIQYEGVFQKESKNKIFASNRKLFA